MNECYTSDDEDADLLNPSFVSGNSGPDRGTKTDRIIKTLLINISFVAMVGLVIEQYEKILIVMMLIHNITIFSIYIYPGIMWICTWTNTSRFKRPLRHNYFVNVTFIYRSINWSDYWII